MNIGYEMLIIAALIAATLVVAQGLERGTIERPYLSQVSLTHN